MPASYSTKGLAAALPILEEDIYSAYSKVKEDGAKEGANPDAILQQLADDLRDAIHSYTTSAKVKTDNEANPGQLAGPNGTMKKGTGGGKGKLI